MNEAEQLPKIKCLFGSSLNSLINDREERQWELNPPLEHQNGDSLSKVFSYLQENGIFNENKTKQNLANILNILESLDCSKYFSKIKTPSS